MMGVAANADVNRPRPQSASDRSTPSQVSLRVCMQATSRPYDRDAIGIQQWVHGVQL